MNVFAFLAGAARRYGEEGAVFHGVERHATWAELRNRALSLGAALRARGAVGDRVLVASANCAEYPEILFGIWAAGQVAVPMNAKLHPREICEAAQDSGARMAFASPELAGAVEGAVEVCITLGSNGYRRLLEGEPAAPVWAQADDLAWLFFTSGTTGRAKGAMLSHRNLTAMSLAHLADLDAVEQGHSLIHAAPMSHGSGLYLLPYVMRGARQVIPTSGGFDPQEMLHLASTHPGAAAFMAPTMVRRLRLHLESSKSRNPELRAIIYGGGPMYLEEIKLALATFGPIVSQLYGQGEAPMTITGLRRDEHLGASDATLNSVGWPRSGVEVLIVDADGRDLPAGDIGEIVCRGDVVMQGYWNNPAATAAAVRDGWLYTGDMGSLDGSGRLTLHDRSKDVVISGGSNIYPREVEEALLGHPEVAEVCVVGLPNVDWGEVVAAVVVREPGSQVTASALEQLCLDRIARFKKPKHYIFVEALPKTAYGKIAKREVLQSLSGIEVLT